MTKLELTINKLMGSQITIDSNVFVLMSLVPSERNT